MEKDAGQSANNSSDFVRKLYKMLEDPSYKQVVRWGTEGDSFVVLDNDKFTKSILPKHFKHSNFASFVRQLNKYDFHKVRHNSEENGQSPYGTGAWEFKHPEFQKDGKDSLDNIRRKAPAPRKQIQSMDESFPAQQIDLFNSQLVATQHQLQQMTDRYNDLAQGHVILLQQVVQLQKIVKNHDGAMQRVMGFLHSVDAQRRGNRIGAPFGQNSASGNGLGVGDLLSRDDKSLDHPASPLQQASQLLGEFSAENLVNKELEQITANYHNNFLQNDYSTPPEHGSVSSSTIIPTDPSDHHIFGNMHNADLEMVYPVGHTNGIDPIDSEHINNIPYALPTNTAHVTNGGEAALEPVSQPEIGPEPPRKKSVIDPGWGPTKPKILLVEDDKTCCRIGCRFLQAFQCNVECARDGLEAVNKVHGGGSYDLILMDIIMPQLDGVSATVCIREVNQRVPIIAMTSNIRSDDIEMYFRYGMNDVLPKPFTREGMLRTLEKHLDHLKRNAYQSQSGFATPAGAPHSISLGLSHMSAASAIKDDPSPGKSPGSSWHSPNPITGTSPNAGADQYMNAMRSSGSYNMSGGHPLSGYQTPTPGMSGPRTQMQQQQQQHRRTVSDMTGGHEDHDPNKRQRIYPPSGGGFVQ